MFGVLGHRGVSVTPGETRIVSWVAGWLGGGGMLVMMCCGSLEFFSNMGPHNSYTFTYPYSHLPTAGITYVSLQMSITITTLD